jgi:lipopolysaccharide transport system ATP-binding protein
MSTVIKVENLSKRYRLGVLNRDMLYKDLQSRWAKFRGKEDPNAPIGLKHDKRLEHGDEFWALRNVDLEVKEGEILGIIGRNGAGKSTLLKILSQITAPTEGRIKVRGRIASLLEVGTGFHPELTGRENVFLNGAILGMTRKEVRSKFDEIVAFADIDEFIDTPVKRYSSGMYVRLAFAVAAHLDPEILIVDEVLAVGDAEFQKKCISKMHDVSRTQGRTILFVSHNMASISNLCSRGLLVQDGRISFDGIADASIEKYLASIYSRARTRLADREDRQGSGVVHFEEVMITDASGRTTDTLISGATYHFNFVYKATAPIKGEVVCAFNIMDGLGNCLVNLSSINATGESLKTYERGIFKCTIAKLQLRSGLYHSNLFCSSAGEVADWISTAFTVQVQDGDFYGTGKIPDQTQGLFLCDCNWESVAT